MVLTKGHKKYCTKTKTNSPITKATERAFTNENIDFFGFENIGKEYEEADINTVSKNFLIENSRAIFDEIEKERSARDSKIDLFMTIIPIQYLIFLTFPPTLTHHISKTRILATSNATYYNFL